MKYKKQNKQKHST